jgi:tetratricopeptide (TPR) repeat protein
VPSFEKAVALRERIAVRSPDGLAERRALANACGKLALARVHALLPVAASTPLFERAHALLMDVVSRTPLDRDARRDLALNYRNLASLYDALGEPGKAVEADREEARLFGRLAEEDPRNEEDRRQSGIALRSLGARLTGVEGVALLRTALDTAEDLLRRDPMSTERQLDLADALAALGANASRRGVYDEAEPILRKACAIRSEVARKDVLNARPLTGLGESHSALARLDLARGRFGRADDEAASGLEVIERFRAAHPEDVRARGIQAGLLITLARLREAQARGGTAAASRARLTEARDLYARSRGIYEEVIPTAPTAARMAAGMARDVERCKAALTALPER